MHEAGAVHRLDRRADRLAVTSETLAQAAQTIGVGRRRTIQTALPMRDSATLASRAEPDLETPQVGGWFCSA